MSKCCAWHGSHSQVGRSGRVVIHLATGAVILKQRKQLMSPQGDIMKKDISLAVMATILVLQLVGNLFGGFVGDIADKAAEALSNRIQIEQMLNGG